MITPEDVKYQLMSTLPRYTDEFGDRVVGSAEVSGGVIEVTAAGHGLSTGDTIVGSDISVRVPITDKSFDEDAGEITLTCGFEHDRTSGSADLGGYNVAVLEGFDDSTYNDSFSIISAARTTVVLAASAAPVDALGYMIEVRSLYFGFLTVTVIDANTFSIAVEDGLPNGAVFESFDFVSEQRILIAADLTRAHTLFSQRRDSSEKPFLFIVFGVETASKDRNVVNDAVLAANSQNPMDILYIPEVVLYEMVGTKQQHSAATKQQEIYASVRPALRQSMYGHVFDGGDTLINFAAHEVSNSPLFFNTSFYIHSFTYNIPYKIHIEQGDTSRRNVSLRSIVVNTKMFDNEGALVSFETEPEI